MSDCTYCNGTGRMGPYFPGGLSTACAHCSPAMTKPWADLRWPGIGRAAFTIALDNGGINRGRSTAQWRREFTRWIEKRSPDLVAAIDTWLAGLNDEQMETVCCGEASETEASLTDAPPFTDDLLNDYFDEVC